MEATLIVLRLPKQIEQRLKALARRTGRSETFYACQAIIRHLDDLEDLHLAHMVVRRLRNGEESTVTLDVLEAALSEPCCAKPRRAPG
ncbi:type II toxin-antitoxin system RelB family antitoxin [Cupriavidus taiwanensis]|uniref:type II toxin-antitoxin system RelB family antitoxin n=1 Tax=Cupriavidus taiwanensis TaxID=164546 RepID=UPI0020C660AE|nr:TraY domain-containing protein [Cupriavidus taiwanensis]